jgi:hypothetical protein
MRVMSDVMSDALSFATQKITLKEEFEQGGILTLLTIIRWSHSLITQVRT